jgi:hypothetical protein
MEAGWFSFIVEDGVAFVLAGAELVSPAGAALLFGGEISGDGAGLEFVGEFVLDCELIGALGRLAFSDEEPVSADVRER